MGSITNYSPQPQLHDLHLTFNWSIEAKFACVLNSVSDHSAASFSMDEDYLIAEVFAQTKTIAMVGASATWKRPSFFVMEYLQNHGFGVIPVNPGLAGQTLNGEIFYESLSAIPDAIDLVDIFRRSGECSALA